MMGLLGGSFDPIHQGHIALAQHLQKHCHLTTIRFIPCKQSVYRDKQNQKVVQTSSEHRLKMLVLALRNFPDFRIDTQEILRTTPSYTLLTLQSLRHENPQVPIALMMGLDAFITLPTWYEWQQLWEYTHFIIVNRANIEKKFPSTLTKFMHKRILTDPKTLHTTTAGHCLFVDYTPPNISSSAIRAGIAENKPLTDALDPAVENYIHQHNLYQNLNGDG